LKTKILALSLLLLIVTMCVTSIPFVNAVGKNDWITSYTIEDYSTGQVLKEYTATGEKSYASILPGTELKVTFTVNVFTSGDGNLKLQTSMKKVLDRFWELDTLDYELGSSYSASSNPTSFNWVKGEFTMIAYGSVPTSASNKAANVTLVKLSSPSGEMLDQIVVSVVSAAGDQYQTLLAEKQDKLQSLIDSGIAAGYIELYTNVLNQSEVEYSQGQVDNAIALLNGLDVSSEPVSSTMEMLFLPIVVVTAVVAVIFVVLFLRIRGKVSYFQLVVEDQIKDLEGLTLRASKIDRALSSNLESIKDRLKRLVGM